MPLLPASVFVRSRSRAAAPLGSWATLWATPLERAADVRAGRLDIRMLVATLTSFGLVERAIDRVPPSTFPPARPHGSKLLEHTGDPTPICVDCKRRAGAGVGAASGNVLVALPEELVAAIVERVLDRLPSAPASGFLSVAEAAE